MNEPTQPAPPPAADTPSQLDAGTIDAPAGPPSLGGPGTPPGFELLEEVGRGGMGVVYRAWDSSLRREVAVKILQDKYDPESAAADRFLDEACITGRLQHPGIPAVYQVGRLADRRPYLAMKLIRGRTLDALVADRSPLDPPAVFEALAQAVGYAHAQGVLHRDLKPQNVMVGAFGEVQVMDWGLAKVVAGSQESGVRSQETEDTIDRVAATHSGARDDDPLADFLGSSAAATGGRTRPGSALGTPAYMPPEQARGETDRVDARSDVFGLGGILAEMLTGDPPFVAPSGELAWQMASNGRVEACLKRLDASTADPELVALCKRCLSPEQPDRPASANEVAAAVAELRRAADERAKRAEQEKLSAEVRAAEQAKRRRVVTRSAAAVVLVLAGGAAASLWQAGEARTAAKNEAEQKRIADDRADAAAKAEAVAVAETKKTQEALAVANARTKSLSDAYGDFVFGIQTKLVDRPGTQDLRKELLTIARAGLAKVLAEARAHGKPDRAIVWSHLRAGDVELQLGMTTAAESEYRAGHELAKRLADADPNDPVARRDLSLSYHKLGDTTLRLGQARTAFDLYQQGHALLEQLAAAAPKETMARRDLGISYSKLCEAALRLGQPKDALDYCQKGLAVRRALADANPADATAQRDLCLSYSLIGDVTIKYGQPKDALDYYQQGHAIRQRLADANPADAEARRDLCVSHGKLGDAALKLGRGEDALGHYQNGLALSRRLADADPKNAQARRDLSISYHNLGDTMLHLGRPKEAVDYYQKDLAVRQPQADANPADAEARRDVSLTYGKLADAALALGNTADAIESYHKSLAGFERLADADPKDARARYDVVVNLYKFGTVFEKLGRHAEAVRWYEKGLAVAGAFHNPSHFATPVKVLNQRIAICKAALAKPTPRELAPPPRPKEARP